ncbi:MULTISPECIES: LysE family translocator [Chromobacterium]|uniref:Amino acid transporter n=3 Tax=Chromobacterium TaxID=535 RepID=A0A1W0CQ55_9NEIS|nr:MULTISPECIES: LysE family translocator [Chromobacterium]AXT48745.1 LysE family translocator [Chromobacterium rhizoryzae]KMN83217.1 amino acid transporter [Chromobacterium sp. LK11]MBK0413152.1 LysE family translocator [Chromobacterium haemolyticum]MBN3004852.1 LysE family translocator [Chromobacterium alkanivorans]MBO0414254.1 LysE family translocator [Chromobacterium haemolyticum]
MSLNTWLLFVTTVFFVSATPGPNMLLAMTHGIHYGVRRTLMTCFGLMTALGLIMFGSAAGLGAVLATSELLFSLVKYAGAAYLIYLGIKTWRSQPQPVEEIREAATGKHTPWGMFRTGFLVAMSNPKAFIFFTALFPQFMNAQQPQGPQLAILAATFYVIEASWQLAYAGGGARLAGWLNSARRLKLVNKVSGGAFVGAGVLLSSVSRH